ncbi:hypothetical protein RHSIM_Rhsim11G0135400 [Rhododendron simsii]|uniref:WRKY19-like zinc finger domain-containing protein n=1 Tax=Rhododendron simsii TaxID=118357 RepID=A0A834LA80_RHOSS|nr:hypothetical protein RHSIM_Rhsim11G0135400 [Rhododendron simsii]
MEYLNKNGVLSCNGDQFTKNAYVDTTLRLGCLGYGGCISTARFGGAQSRTNPEDMLIPSNAPDGGRGLVLGLGPTPSTYSGAKRKRLVPIVHQGLFSESDSVPRLGLFGGNEEVSATIEYSGSTQTDPKLPHLRKHVSTYGNRLGIPIAHEGSSSAKKSSGGYMPPSLLLAPRIDPTRNLFQAQELLEPRTKFSFSPSQVSYDQPSAAITDYSISTFSGVSSDRRISNPKKCKFEGCSKVARGAAGLCIGHGGGQRCQRPGCNKGAASRTAYCKAHGGGKRCQQLGCSKSAEAHGGGRRCGHKDGCTKAARGKSGLCVRHGGGIRCKVEGCTRSAEGQIGLCIAHGGGRRCHFIGCSKGAQGSTVYCKAHGGGKRCVFAGCTKGAEGSTPLCKRHGGGKRCLHDGGGICPKSVHGGTSFCVAHGGGKRCCIPGCGKSARGRTDCCVKHGGGKRCEVENCGKGAQGSTEFCKAHGGGKRCNWGDGRCEKLARSGKSGLCAAHYSLVQGLVSSSSSTGAHEQLFFLWKHRTYFKN